ncbi:hypothetical protein [Tenacibaculum aestuarii]|uniref:hypothetical protein n=1 Tax=Tenacibaculum aestuarii TaxID=362781 RepID=UPI003894891E
MSNVFNKYLFLVVFLLKGWSTSYADYGQFNKSISVPVLNTACVETQFITQNINDLVFDKNHEDSERENYFEINEVEDKTQEEDEIDRNLSKFGGYFSAILHAQFFENQLCVVKEKTQRCKEYLFTSILKLHVKYQVFII